MVASIEQIEREISALKASMGAIAQEIYQGYRNYLTVLGRAVRQQLILASYHICTQAYPEAFLQLSFSRRQNLQQDLQQLSQDVETALSDSLQHLAPLESEAWTDPDPAAQGLEQLETAITEELRRVSRETNQHLQDCNILGETPLEMILEVAAKAENAGRAIMSSPPNLLTALVEKEDGDEPEETTIVAIYLQLSEIEFADVTVMGQRNQLRQILGQFADLQQQLSEKQRQRLVAEAIASWRASWPT